MLLDYCTTTARKDSWACVETVVAEVVQAGDCSCGVLPPYLEVAQAGDCSCDVLPPYLEEKADHKDP